MLRSMKEKAFRPILGVEKPAALPTSRHQCSRKYASSGLTRQQNTASKPLTAFPLRLGVVLAFQLFMIALLAITVGTAVVLP